MTLSHRFMRRVRFAFCGVLAEHSHGKPAAFHDLTAKVRLALTHTALKSEELHKNAAGQAMACMDWNETNNVMACAHLVVMLDRDEVATALQAVDGDASE